MVNLISNLRTNFKFRYIFQAIFLFFSCYLLVNYLTGLVDDPVLKKGVALFAICLDVSMQFVILARGKKSWRKGKWSKGFSKYRVMALLLFLLYAIYVIFYAVLSAVGFFLVEVDQTEARITEIKNIQSDRRERLNEIAAEMDALTVQLKTEGMTGYGQNSKIITARMDALKAERQEFQQNNSESLTVKEKMIKSAVNSFEVLSNNLGIPPNRLKIFIFGIAVVMLQVIIVLTSWNGEVERRNPNRKFSPAVRKDKIPYGVGGKVLLESASPGNSSGTKSTGSGPKTLDNELFRFTEALFNDTKKLNGDPVVALKTGIPPERCAKYRQYLSSLRIGAKTAIFKTQGGSVANFPKGDLLDYIRSNVSEAG